MTNAFCRGREGVIDLPPTSLVIEGHICRAHFLIREATAILDPHKTLQLPLDSDGWEQQHSVCVAKKLDHLDQKYYMACNCKKKRQYLCAKYNSLYRFFHNPVIYTRRWIALKRTGRMPLPGWSSWWTRDGWSTGWTWRTLVEWVNLEMTGRVGEPLEDWSSGWT